MSDYKESVHTMANTHNVISLIESRLEMMTDVEQTIAHYFIQNGLTETNLSSQHLAQVLHISQAAFTRFAKKCGFNGYREFVFEFLSHQEKLDSSFPQLREEVTKRVLADYDHIMRQSHDLIDEAQLQRVAEMIEKADRVYFFGKGSSGLVAREMKSRLMRLGVVCEAMTDRDSFAWTLSILDEKCLVIAFSLSGQTVTVIDNLRAAKDRGAQTVLFTTDVLSHASHFTEIIPLASALHLDYGTRISPQFPVLIMLDILYAYFMEIDRPRKEAIFNTYIENYKTQG